jgi:HTH-type transcriptional regulator/antitoxin HipB
MKMACVYVAKNKLMPGFCKIGASEDAQKRVEGLYGSWEVAHTWVMDRDRARYYESETKHKLRSFAVVGYELFNCPVKFLIETVDNIMTTAMETQLPPTATTIRANVSDIGRLARRARKAQKLTIMECSGLTNIGYRFISNIENGKETARIGKVLALLDRLGVKLYAHYQE